MDIRREGINTQVSDISIKTFRGFTLFAAVASNSLYLIDMTGRPVHTWNLPFELGTHGVLLPNGNLLCAARVPEGPLADLDGAAGRLVEVDWQGNIVWQYEDPYMHHYFYRMPNGNTIILRWVPTPRDIAERVKGGLPGTERQEIMWSDSLREINSNGEVLWEWIGFERLDPELDIICPLCFRNEWTHANAFVVIQNGDILISFMKTNSIAIIKRQTSDIVWRWGGFLTLAHPHDVSWLGDDHVMVLGCGGHIAGSEVGDCEVIRIDVKTNNTVWDFKELNSVDFYTYLNGSLQYLPNGNILICEGDSGRIFEVSDEKEIVWEFINPYYQDSPIYGNSNMLFRAYRYGSDYEGLPGNILRRDKVQERAKPQKREETIKDRLRSLGY